MFNIFDIAGSGMSAQTLRLNTTASNMSNAETPASTAETAYRARYPIFKAIAEQHGLKADQGNVAVEVTGIYESTAAARKLFQPGHAMADKEGFVYLPNVNVVEEMANMISASRSYQMNVQVMNTAKSLMQKTLQLGE